MGVFLLLFLTSTTLVAASPSVYLVESVGFDGIYEERSNPRLHYKEIANVITITTNSSTQSLTTSGETLL